MSSNSPTAEPRVAIVCDWLTNVGGAERVVKSLHELFPEAPIYTSQYDPKGIDWFKNADVRTGWMNHLPPGLRKFFPLLRSVYFSRLNLTDYDLVLSSTGAEAKAVRTRKDALHICYMHAPTQYYWSLYNDYLKQPGFGRLDPVVRLLLRLLVGPLRRLDKKFASRPDVIVTNSTYVQREVKKYYNRESTVIFPPVATDTFTVSSSKKRHGFVVTSRQVPWKRLDIAIIGCRAAGESLSVVGDGSEHDRLVSLADGDPLIRFLPTQDDAGLQQLFAKAEGFLFPSLEPFGIAPVEALAAGVPVVAYGAGGALDYVSDGQNGLLFDTQTAESVTAALKRFRTTHFDQRTVSDSAARFSTHQFKSQIQTLITRQQEQSHEKS